MPPEEHRTIQRNPKVPAYAWAVIECLNFSGEGRRTFPDQSEADWKKLLRFCDQTQLTLSFAQACGDQLPDWVEHRLARNLAQNALRWEKIKAAFNEYALALSLANIPCALLKGFSHCPDLVPDPRLRVQYDLDFLFLPEDVQRACDVARRLGFESIEGFDGCPTDHLPTMVRKTGWDWTGDYFDVDIPVSLELHFRLWDNRMESFTPEGLEQFWTRRQVRILEDVTFSSLHAVDLIGYACLHALRHILRGALRPAHLYEIAFFLHKNVNDHSFWTHWEEMHTRSLRHLETIVFGLASAWFGCRLPSCIQDSLKCLPLQTRRWLTLYGESPLVGLFYPNKDELWLHWNLVQSLRSRFTITARRLFPRQLPGSVRGIHIPRENISWNVRLNHCWAYIRFVARRASYHLGALVPTVRSAIRWWCTSAR